MIHTTPHNIEAEQALLGAWLAYPGHHDRIMDMDTHAFYAPVHKLIYAAIRTLAHNGDIITSNGIVERLKGEPSFMRHGERDGGGLDYLFLLADRAPSPATVGTYADMLCKLSMKRDLVDAGNYIALQARGTAMEPDQVISAGEGALHEILRGNVMDDQWKDGQALSTVIIDKIERRRKASYLSTGYAQLDRLMGGVRIGRLSIIAGRPSMGKSAVGVELMRAVAQTGRGVGLFSLEMDEEELALRLACGVAFDRDGRDGPVYFDAQRDAASDGAKAALRQAAAHVSDLRINIDDRSGLSPGQIVPAAKRLIRKWQKAGVEPGMIMIDHLHLVKPEVERYGNRAAEIGDVSNALRELAKDTGVAVVALCQLNREVENRKNTDKRPQLSDLKWSGNIEEDANTITFIYRPEYYLIEPEDTSDDKAMMEYMDAKMKWDGKMMFLVRKNRGGPNLQDCVMNISLPHNALWECQA